MEIKHYPRKTNRTLNLNVKLNIKNLELYISEIERERERERERVTEYWRAEYQLQALSENP